MTEHDEQVTFFEWLEWAHNLHPDLGLQWVFAIPNGGQRHPAVAAKLKAEGVKPGVWDICVPIPRDNFNSLYIEMKWGYNKLTDNQSEFGAFLEKQGFCTAVCYNSVEAQEAISNYLGI